MNELHALTRRHFFKQAGFGIGGAALALVDAGAALRAGGQAAGAARRAEGQAGHLPVHGRRAVAARPVRQQAGAAQVRRAGRARRDRQGRALRVHQGHAEDARLAVRRSARHGQSGQEISDLLPHLATIADDIAIVKSMQTTQFNHAPAQIFMNTGHQVIGRPSMGSWLSYGLGSRQQGPARLRRADLRREQPRRRQVVLGLGLPADRCIRACEFRGGARSGAVRLQPGRRGRAAAARVARRPEGPQRPAPGRRRRPGDRDAHRRVRTRLPDADERAGADRHLRRAAGGPRPVRHAARADRRSPTTACSRAGWSSAACASCSSTTAAGTPTAPASARTSSRSCRTCAGRPISRPRRSSRTSSSAACSTRRSSSGAASSAARR